MAFQNDGRATGVRIIVVRPSLPEIQASLDMTQRVSAHLVFLRAGMRIPQAAISSVIKKPASVWASMVTMTCGPAGRYLCCSNRFSRSGRTSTSMWTPSLPADLRRMLRNLVKWSPATRSTVTLAMRRHSPSSTLGVDTSAGALPAEVSTPKVDDGECLLIAKVTVDRVAGDHFTKLRSILRKSAGNDGVHMEVEVRPDRLKRLEQHKYRPAGPHVMVTIDAQTGAGFCMAEKIAACGMRIPALKNTKWATIPRVMRDKA